MEVTLKPGAWVEIARMLQVIKDSGFKPGDAGVMLRVTGKLVKQGDQLALELDRMKAPRTLVVTAAREDPDIAARLTGHLGQPVEIEGLWTGPEAKEGGLAVTAILSDGGKADGG
jgi:hypothetical protein